MKPFLSSGALVVAVAVAWSVLPAGGQAQLDAGKSRTVRGRIAAVGPADNQLLLRTSDGKELRLHVDERSRLRLDQREARLGQFKEGTRVTVTFEPRAGLNRVVTLSDAPVSAEDLRREVRDALEAAKAYTFQQKDEYQRRLEALTRELDERIDDLRDRAEAVGAEARKEYAQEIEELRQRREAVRQRLARVKSASAEAWEDIKSGVSAALEDLQKAYERARSRFK
jgi:hypothetical protein